MISFFSKILEEKDFYQYKKPYPITKDLCRVILWDYRGIIGVLMV